MIQRFRDAALAAHEIAEVSLDDRRGPSHARGIEDAERTAEGLLRLAEAAQVQQRFGTVAVELGDDQRLGGKQGAGAVEVLQGAAGIVLHAVCDAEVDVGPRRQIGSGAREKRRPGRLALAHRVVVTAELRQRVQPRHADPCILDVVVGDGGRLVEHGERGLELRCVGQRLGAGAACANPRCRGAVAIGHLHQQRRQLDGPAEVIDGQLLGRLGELDERRRGSCLAQAAKPRFRIEPRQARKQLHRTRTISCHQLRRLEARGCGCRPAR